MHLGSLAQSKKDRCMECIQQCVSKFNHIIIKLIRFNFPESISYKHKLVSLARSLALSTLRTFLSMLFLFLSNKMNINITLVLTFNILHKQSNPFKPKRTATTPFCVCVYQRMHLLHMPTCHIPDCKLNHIQYELHILLLCYVMLLCFALVVVVLSSSSTSSHNV